MSDTLSRLVVEIGGDASGLQREMDAAEGKAGSFGSKVAGFLGPAIAVGAAAGGAAIVGIGVAALDAAGEVQSATSRMQAQLGITREEAQGLGRVATDVFKNNFGGSITEASETVMLLRRSFDDLSNTDLQGLAEHAFRLKDAFGTETADSVSAVKTLVEKFGISSEEAFDLLTAGYQRGLDRNGDFLDSIGEYSTQFSAGGMSAAQMFSVMESGLGGAVLGTDKAADAFKEFRVRIQDGSTLTAESLAMLGINAEELGAAMASGQMTAAEAFELVLGKLRETDNTTVRMQAGVGLLGTQFEDLGTEGALALTTMGTAFDNVAGRTRELDVQYSSLGQVFESLRRRAIVDFLVPLGDMMLDLINGPIRDFARTLQEMDWSGIQDGARAAADFIRDNVVPVFRQIIEAAGEVVDFIVDHWPEIEGAFRAVFDAVRPVVEEVFGFLRDQAAEMVAFFQENWPQIAEAAENTFDHLRTIVGAVVAVLLALWEQFGSDIARVITLVWSNVKTIIETALDVIKGIILTATALINGDWQGAWDSFKGIFESIVSGLANILRTQIEILLTIVRGIGGAIRDGIGDLSGVLVDAGRQIVAGLRAGFQAAWDEFVRWLQSLYARIPKPDIPFVPGLKTFADGGDGSQSASEERLAPLFNTPDTPIVSAEQNARTIYELAVRATYFDDILRRAGLQIERTADGLVMLDGLFVQVADSGDQAATQLTAAAAAAAEFNAAAMALASQSARPTSTTISAGQANETVWEENFGGIRGVTRVTGRDEFGPHENFSYPDWLVEAYGGDIDAIEYDRQRGLGRFARGSTGHAAGGIFTSPVTLQDMSGAFHSFGEAGPEALIPLKNWQTGKFGLFGPPGQTPIIVNVTLNNPEVYGHDMDFGRRVVRAVKEEMRAGGLVPTKG